MREISSGQTFFLKKIFPVIWYGALGYIIARALAAESWKTEPLAVLAPTLMLLGGYLLMKRYVSTLADKVLDGGSFLLVRRGLVKQRIALEDIDDVHITRNDNPPRLTLKLRVPGKLGKEIVFIPKGLVLVPFFKHPLGAELAERVKRLRTN
ncbi:MULTISPECIES: hypothetical protein [Lysobacter]|uniref:hypothetical protein n=1 Tax=Lysobacter TaxID=68 RepID=UPI0004D0028F|nr:MULTISPECIES: hypothetical protein [Lysobacter]